jgi:hypothetical protein
MPFELFVPGKKKHESNRSSCIGFSTKMKKLSIYRPILEKYFQDKQFVHLYYDKDEKLIGIKPTDKADETTIKLTGGTTKILMIGRFLKRYDIDIKENIQLPFEERNNMLILKVE